MIERKHKVYLQNFVERNMHILPQPKKIERLNGSFCIDKNCDIHTNPLFLSQANRFAELVENCCGFRPSVVEDMESSRVIFNLDENYRHEQYSVMISDGVATVIAGDEAGCFYAVETLRQLLSLDFKQEIVSCENCYLTDQPKFGYRGLMLDVCRHFFGVDTVKTIIDLMARLKMNKLHLHLSDDQGFRMEIKKYPLVNTIGSVRGGSEVVSDGKRYVDEIPHEGYFTQDELRGLVAYAQERHIDIVPEFDVPGHCIALIAAYPELSCSGKVTEVRKKWGISKDILCAGNDKVYEVVRDILDEICDVFPSEYIHLGGDEAPKERWCNCKLCKQRLSELKLGSFEKLQTYMVECFREHLAEKGRKVICWNDGLGDDANGEIVSQVWWVHGCAKRAATKQINNGRKAIMSATPYVYFDYPYSVTPLKKTLSYNPLGGVRASARENVLGVEGALWTEYVADTDKLFFNLLPRLDVLAECAWGYHTNKFFRYLREKFAVYSALGLTFNGNINDNGPIKRRTTTRKFWYENSNVEVDAYKAAHADKD